MACVAQGSSTTNLILPKDIEEDLPPLANYALPEGTGIINVRVRDHKSRNLRVAVWLHCLDMTLSGGLEA